MKLDSYGTPTTQFQRSIIGRVTFERVPVTERKVFVLAVRSVEQDSDVGDYVGLLVSDEVSEERGREVPIPTIHKCGDLRHLASGDIISLQSTGHVRTLFRKASR